MPGLRPPLLERLAVEAEARLDVVRNYLRFYGPARQCDVASFLNASAREVKASAPSGRLSAHG